MVDELTITRPDGTVVYKLMLNPNGPDTLLGNLVVSNGQLELRACVEADKGSIVRPLQSILGDLNFRLKKGE